MAALKLKWPDRLWKRLEVEGVIRTDPPSEWPREPCWLWLGAKNGPRKKRGKTIQDGGYGYVWDKDKRAKRVHLVTYRELRGFMPDGYLHSHTCDIHHCGNPWHVVPGTYGSNNQETYDRGRR